MAISGVPYEELSSTACTSGGWHYVHIHATWAGIWHRCFVAGEVEAIEILRQELSGLTDPNAVRFPYSTYSLPMTLARDVGGWDVEWIAEDYHMGIKFL